MRTWALLAAACAMALMPVDAASAESYFVSAGADLCSTALGTRASPYCTISAALAAHHSAGTSISVLPGIYREQVTVPASGTSGSPIVLQAVPQGGQPVVIDGSDDFSDAALWTPHTAGVWVAPSVTWSPVQVFADSVRLTASAASPDQLPLDSFTYVDSAGLYVNLGGDSPAAHHLAVGHRPFGIYVSNRSSVSIAGFTVTRSEDHGIRVTNTSDDVDIDHVVVTFSGRFGVQIDNSSRVRLGSSVIFDNADHGIALTAGSTNCTIEDDESFRNYLPGRHSADGIFVYSSAANLIQRNNFHDNQVSGEDLQGGSSGNLSIQNRSWNNGLTGFNHVNATGNVHNGDVAFGNNWDGFAMDNGSTGQVIHNCIAVGNGLVHSRYDLEVDSSSTAGLVSDDNIFWLPSGAAPVRYASTSYRWVRDYTTVCGQDTRTIQSDPLFAAPFAGDYHLQAGSPAIDDANSATPGWPATDAAGQARIDDAATPNTGLGPVTYADRGAYEFVPSGGPPPPRDTVPSLDHIIMVIMENKAYNKVRFAPYTADLIAHSASFAHSYAFAHQSQSDYYAIWGAVGRKVTESICPAVGSPYNTENLGHLCETHGVSWRAYSEDLPAPGDTVCHVANYARRHDPWTDWGNLNHMNERPYSDLAVDIANGTLPRLAMVVPNLCDDTHNNCGQDTIKVGDDWLSNNVPAMIRGAGRRGLVIVTWDEDDGSDGNHILTVFSSPLAKTGFISNRFINHFVVTRTICAALGLPAFAEAALFSPITDVWLESLEPPPPPPPAPTMALGPAVPNPSHGTMNAMLELPSQVSMEASIFDLSGRRVRTVISGPRAGRVEITWDGRDERGRAVHSGIYMLHVRAGSRSLERKLLLVR